MTEKQKNYIKYLDNECLHNGVPISASDDNLLGKNWEQNFKNITPTYTDEVITTMLTALGRKPNPKPQKKRRR